MRRRYILIAGLVLAALLIWALLPKSRMINVRTTVYEYALDQKEPIGEHEITIGGRFTRRLFRENVFRGHMLISGYPETNGASAYIQFWKEHAFGTISYQQGGIPVWETELEQIYTNDDFSAFAIQLFEVTKDGDQLHSGWSSDTGRILTTAPDYDAMTELCAGLGLPIAAEGGQNQ